MRCLSFILAMVLLPATLIFSTGCEGEVSFTTAELSEATMALGVDNQNKPVDPTNVFKPGTEEIFCSARLSNAPSDTEINSVWIYVTADNYEIDSFAINTDGNRYLQFSMNRPTSGWPEGDYKLVLYIDGEEAVSLPFSVQP